MKKLLLKEDIIEQQPEEAKLSLSTGISTLIKGTWDLIDTFNGMKITFNDINVDDEINDLYVIIGQLEGKLQDINPQAEFIDAGDDAQDQDYQIE